MMWLSDDMQRASFQQCLNALARLDELGVEMTQAREEALLSAMRQHIVYCAHPHADWRLVQKPWTLMARPIPEDEIVEIARAA